MASAPPSVLAVRPVEAVVIDRRAVGVVRGGEGVGLRRLDADDIEPDDPVALGPVVVPPERDLRLDDDAFGEGLLQLLQVLDAELGEVALRHRQGGLAEPDVVPDPPAGVLAVAALRA